MDKKEIIEKVNAILADQLIGVETGDVRPDLSLATDLGADSIDAVDISMAIERTFSISLPESVWDDMKDYRVHEIYDMVGELIDKQQ